MIRALCGLLVVFAVAASHATGAGLEASKQEILALCMEDPRSTERSCGCALDVHGRALDADDFAVMAALFRDATLGRQGAYDRVAYDMGLTLDDQISLLTRLKTLSELTVAECSRFEAQ